MSIVTLQRKQGYILKGSYTSESLSLFLTNIHDHIQFSIILTHSSLDNHIKSNFNNLSQIWRILSQTQNYLVGPAVGVIVLKQSVHVNNGIIKNLQTRIKMNLLQSSVKEQPNVQEFDHFAKKQREQSAVKGQMEEKMAAMMEKMVEQKMSIYKNQICQKQKILMKVIDQNGMLLKMMRFMENNQQQLQNKVSQLGLKCQVLQNKLNQVLDQLMHKSMNEKEGKKVINEQIIMLKRDRVEDYLDKNCASYKNIKIDQNKIIHIKNQDSQLLTNVSVKKQKSMKFKITRSFDDHISFGVINSEYRDQQYSWYNRKRKQVVWYTGKSGIGLFQGGNAYKVPGNGFKQGDQVIVEVDTDNGIIKWYRNGEISLEYRMKLLKNQDIDWVYFILFHNSFDMVQILS